MIDFTLAEILTGLDLSDEPSVRIKQLLRVIDFFGSMHIIVEDGNTQDSDLDFVEQLMAERPPIPAEIELLALLRPLSPSERFKAILNETEEPE